MKKTHEAEILNQMIAPPLDRLPPEAVNALLAVQFKPAAIERMNELAEKNRADTLTAEEKDEMESYRRVGNFLSLVKAKARLSLSQSPSTP